MFRRWSHVHSHVSGGTIALLAVEYRIWLLLALAFLLGIAFEWTRRTLSTMAEHFLWKRRRRLTASAGVARRTERVSPQDDPSPLLGDD